jgi:hypothetical protein
MNPNMPVCIGTARCDRRSRPLYPAGRRASWRRNFEARDDKNFGRMRGASGQDVVNPLTYRPRFVGSVVIALVAAVTCTFAAPPASVPRVVNLAASSMDYPLALHTRWTYHLRREPQDRL